MKTTHVLAALAAIAAAATLPSIAAAQRPVRRQAPIEIRGTVPTPQVTTVRPRETPTFDRRVLVPAFYNHNFWQSILPAYQLVPARVVTGAAPAATTPAANTGSAPAAGAPPASPSVTPPAGAPPARPAGTTPGTAPATAPR